MRDRDDWEVWDDGDGRANRPDGPDVAGPVKRGGHGLLIGLIIGGFFILSAVAVALFFVFDDDRPNNPPMAFNPPMPLDVPPPGRFGPGGGPGGPAEDWTPADEDARKQVRAAFRTLGRALQKPDFDPAQHFDLPSLTTATLEAVPLDLSWGQAVFAGGGPGPGAPAGAGGGQPGAPAVDTANAARGYLRNARPSWRRRTWEDIDIRQVLVTNRDLIRGPVLLAMAWQRQPDGPPLKWLWHFTRPDGADGNWKVAQWEDATTGMTGAGEMALDLIVTAERRWDLYPYRQLRELHRSIDDLRYEDAERLVSALYRTRPPAGLFADVCELADAKLRLRRFDTVGASARFESLAERPTDMLPLVPLRAEAATLQRTPARALELCERYTKMYGDDPHVLAHMAAALVAMNRPEEARKPASAALADDPDHVVALDAVRKMGGEPGAFLGRVRAANRFPTLFPALARGATMDRDWPALVRLAEEYIARRPDDPSGPETLVRALAESGDPAAAVRVFDRHTPHLAKPQRLGMVYAIVAAASRAGKATELYATLPDEHRDEFFLRLARDLDLLSDRFRANDDELDVRTARKQLVALLAAHAAHRPGAAAVTLYEAKELIRDKKWADAEKKLAGIRLPTPARLEEYDSLDVLVRNTRLEVFHELKMWEAAFDALTPTGLVLSRLATRSVAEKRWADLAAILEAYQKKSPDAVELAYWTGTLLAGRNKHADARAEFEKVLASKKPPAAEFDEDDEPDRIRSAREGFARAAIKVGKAAEAVTVLEGDDFPNAALYAFALASSGEVPRAIRYLEGLLEDNPFFLNSLDTDPDLGPLLDKPDFADFRAKYPKQPRRNGGPDEE